MARIEVVMPQMGESIAEGTIIKWHKKVGERVEKDETLLEISTDKVDSEIPSPEAGVLAEIVVPENKTVEVRTVIAYLETSADVTLSAPAAVPAAPAAPPPESPVPVPVPTAGPTSGRFYSPLVMNVARAEGISMTELEAIPGSGEGGRVTKKDLIAYVESKKSGKPLQVPGPVPAPVEPSVPPAPPAPSVAPAASPARVVPAAPVKSVDAPELRLKYPAPDFDILQMSPVMQKMAQHMVSSVQTSPHVAAVHEVDMTTIVRHRAENASAFEAKEGFKLTFTPYIINAVVRSIKIFPLINSSIEGDKIIRKNVINLGLAVAAENGLIVPVIKHAEEKNFLGFARAVNDLATRTRSKKLMPDDIQGGTFTISNYGVFGTLIGTPIINQPQVAILGTGAIKKRLMVNGDAIVIRSMAYFTMSFDHRVVDGALGGMFLQEVVTALEEFDGSLKF